MVDAAVPGVRDEPDRRVRGIGRHGTPDLFGDYNQCGWQTRVARDRFLQCDPRRLAATQVGLTVLRRVFRPVLVGRPHGVIPPQDFLEDLMLSHLLILALTVAPLRPPHRHRRHVPATVPAVRYDAPRSGEALAGDLASQLSKHVRSGHWG